MALSIRSYEGFPGVAFNNAHAGGWEMSRGYVYLELRRTLRYGDS